MILPVDALLIIPAIAVPILALVSNYRLGAALNVIASGASLAAGIALLFSERVRSDLIIVDDFNVYLITLTTLIGFTTSVFSASYIAHEIDIGRLTPAFLRFYHAMYQALLGAMNVALLANNIGLMWVGVEVATLCTVMMVGIYRTPEAIEAAWKYFILGSVGIALAFFGTVLVYLAAQELLGDGLPAIRLERAVTDLYGYIATGAPDARPWLDHGAWRLRAPLGVAEPAPLRDPVDYAFQPVHGEGLHQIPVGPVHAGIIEPGHFRFTANGETVARLEARLGYVHKGIDGLLTDVDCDKAARIVARASGDSTVALSFAFARALEAAQSTEVPPRAQVIRAVMAELERMANHFGDIGAICNDAAFALLHSHCGCFASACWRQARRCSGIGC